MGIYILAAIYVYVLIGLLTEVISYITSKESRDHINEAPILHTLVFAFCGLPITVMSIIEVTSERIKERRSEKTQNENLEE